MLYRLITLGFVFLLVSPAWKVEAQVTRTREFFREIRFSTKEKEEINPLRDSLCVGTPVQVTVRWNKKYLDKIEFDSVCFVRKLSLEEQQRTGKKEEYIRDASFAPYKPTPEEIKEGKFTFMANPRYSVRFFFTQHYQSYIPQPKGSFYHPLGIVDKKGKGLFYNNKK